MKKCLLTALSAICILFTYSQVTYTGTLAATDPTFNRPDEGSPPTTLSNIGTNVYYDVIQIDITVAGLITFNCISAWDNYCILYNTGGFNPALPLNNAILANDDFSAPNSGFVYDFPTPGIYYLVICSFKNGANGSYTINQSETIILPLRLLSFSASKAGTGTNLIKWSSADETNLETYQVQRGADGKNFEDLKNGRIDARNSATAISYKFNDNSPAKGQNYYRLKITERSGTVSYGPVAMVKNTGMAFANVLLYPNPSSDYVRMEIKSMQNKNASITIINSGGRIMQRGQYRFNDQGVLSVGINRLSAGKYFLKTTTGGEVNTSSFIKR